MFLSVDQCRFLGLAASLPFVTSDTAVLLVSPSSCTPVDSSRCRGISENPGEIGDNPIVKPGRGGPGEPGVLPSPSLPVPGDNKVPLRIVLLRGGDTGGVRSGGWVEPLSVRVRVIMGASARYSDWTSKSCAWRSRLSSATISSALRAASDGRDEGDDTVRREAPLRGPGESKMASSSLGKSAGDLRGDIVYEAERRGWIGLSGGEIAAASATTQSPSITPPVNSPSSLPSWILTAPTPMSKMMIPPMTRPSCFVES